MKESSHELESIQEETDDKKNDSNQHSQKEGIVTKERQAATERFSPYIAAVAADFSREFGDPMHEASNMRQALNLWQASGLAEQTFVELMQEARRLTRRYQSRPTWDTMINKMAYYFQTLRDLIARAETDLQ